MGVWHKGPSDHVTSNSHRPIFVGETRPEGCPFCARENSRQRIESACIAMARIMVFVWMECMAQADANIYQDNPIDDWRSFVLTDSIARGLFRLEFAR